MKNISKMFKRMFQASVFLSVLSLIFGLVLLLNTEDILTTISLVLGGGLLFIGILLCVRYFGKETIISSLEANLQLGILSILLGLTLIIFKNIFAKGAVFIAKAGNNHPTRIPAISAININVVKLNFFI